MRMIRILCVMLCLLLLPLPIAARAENGYIVKLASVKLSAADDDDAPLFTTVDDYETAELYRNLGLIEYFEENYTVTLCDNEITWAHIMLNLPAVWRTGALGTGVRVGVVDSGIYPHDDLKANLTKGYNSLDGSSNTTDTYGHGTNVAGVIAATINDVGIVGVAPGATLIPLKAFDGKTTQVDKIVSAIEEGLKEEYAPDILNMSFGFSSNSKSLRETIAYAQSKDVIMVAASGNEGTSAIAYPGGYEGVISVGAVNAEKKWANYSQYNDTVDICAPGSSIYSTTKDNAYETQSGTSFSTPMITGLLALALAKKPDTDRELITAALLETAADLGAVGRDPYYGCGLADAEAFFNELEMLDRVHMRKYASGGVTLFFPTAQKAYLMAAEYESDRKLAGVTGLKKTFGKGYISYALPVTKKTKVFLFPFSEVSGKDRLSLQPLCDVLELLPT